MRHAKRDRLGERTLATLFHGWPAALCAALLVASAALPGSAQEEKAPAAEDAPESAVEVVPDELGRGSPRGAALGYLAACRDGDYERAARYLDLRSSGDEDGALLARRLRIVLSRELWVDPESLSREPEGQENDGLPASRDRVGRIDTKRGEVDVLLQRVPRGDGVRIWKVAASTVEKVPALWDEFGYGELERFLPEVFFDLQFLGVALWQWIGLLCLVLATAIVSWLLAVVIVFAVRTLVRRTETDVDDALLDGAGGPLRLALAVPVFRGGLVPLDLGLAALGFIGSVLSAIFIVAVTWLLFRVTDVLAARVEHRLRERDQAAAISVVPPGRKALKAILAALAFVAVLDSFGFSVTALIAGLGVGGIAVALAAQKTVENLFGGLTLYADRPVRVGDFCRFGDKVGTVEEIGLRSTRVRTLGRTLMTIPNAEFANLQLENFAARDEMWLSTTIGVRYETTPEQLRYILVEIRKLLYAHERVTPDPARIRFVGFGAYSLDLEIFAYVDTRDWNEFLGIREDVYLRIMDVVERSGSGFAFPSQTLYLGSDDAPGEERAAEVAEEVRGWRERGELFIPEFPPERISELRGSVGFPAEGSPGHRGGS